MNRRASHRVSYEIVSDYPLTSKEVCACENEECENQASWEVGIAEEGRYPQFPTMMKLCDFCRKYNVWDVFFKLIENVRSQLEELKAELKWEDERRPF